MDTATMLASVVGASRTLRVEIEDDPHRPALGERAMTGVSRRRHHPHRPRAEPRPGESADRIIDILKKIENYSTLIKKHFFDLEVQE